MADERMALDDVYRYLHNMEAEYASLGQLKRALENAKQIMLDATSVEEELGELQDKKAKLDEEYSRLQARYDRLYEQYRERETEARADYEQQIAATAAQAQAARNELVDAKRQLDKVVEQLAADKAAANLDFVAYEHEMADRRQLLSLEVEALEVRKTEITAALAAIQEKLNG